MKRRQKKIGPDEPNTYDDTMIDAALFSGVRPSAKISRVAELLDCDERTVRRMVRDGTIKAHIVGKRGIRVFLDSASQYQERNGVEPVLGAAERRAIEKRRSAINSAAHRAAVANLKRLGIV